MGPYLNSTVVHSQLLALANSVVTLYLVVNDGLCEGLKVQIRH